MNAKICMVFGILALFQLTNGNPFERAADKDLTTPELAQKYGYPAETHKVTTGDGYILTVHRIPHGKNPEPAPAEGRPVVWLQHGLMGCSSNWVISGVGQGLAYRLADQGYDVWMGNARGNTYSRAHVSLSNKSDEFWDFSWDQMGMYDLPAYFDYVTEQTGQETLYYAGHSMGTTMFFTCMSLRPEYNAKIRLMSALAPVSFTEHMISPISLFAPIANSVEDVLNMLGAQEFLPNGPLMDFLGATVCHENSPIQPLCSSLLFLVMGYDSEQLDGALLPTLMGHCPAGSSVRSVVHYAQGVNSGKFRRFNHGKEKNLVLYGQEDPPEYDVSKITAPVAFYWGENDWLAAKSDVYRLADMLPNLVRKYRIAHDKFNHLDFIIAIDSVDLLYSTLEKFMKMF